MSLNVPGWKTDGVAVNEATSTIPYDGVLLWAAGDILGMILNEIERGRQTFIYLFTIVVGGISVVLSNNETGAVICSSTRSVTGELSSCSLNTQIAKVNTISLCTLYEYFKTKLICL